ncbi:hypothetical protein LCGC14_1759620 [marine sediment metagenome]|uniref:Uncharacterized protein n=1 Tax=marine sediment metagenome TaxID=412755 RepID=A0A0F9H1J3_9ZZZZ
MSLPGNQISISVVPRTRAVVSLKDINIAYIIGKSKYTYSQVVKFIQTIMNEALELTIEETKEWIYEFVPLRSGDLQDNLIEFLEKSKPVVEEITGVPVDVQEVINRRYAVSGVRFSDLYPLDSLQRKVLYELDMYKAWAGVTTPLYPSSWQEEDRAVMNYYRDVEAMYDDARVSGLTDEQGNLVSPSVQTLNAQMVSREIGPEQWVSMRGDLISKISTAASEIGKRIYPDVPKTIEEREVRYAERNIPAPTFTPDQELLYKYYELKPEYKWDWEAGRFTFDFDTYYAMIDVIISGLKGPWREQFVERIQYEWTPMERLYWDTSREYLRPYRLVRNAVMMDYDDEQKRVIRRYEVAHGTERKELLEVIDPRTGNKLISQFNADLRGKRKNLRMVSPTLDAWLNFWGKTDKLLTPEAESIYTKLQKDFMTPEMIK